MDPAGWRDMVDRTHELEAALGSREKRLADNEHETVVVQRRGLRAARDLDPGTVLTRDLLDVLRPVVSDGIFPYELPAALGRRVVTRVAIGEALRWDMLILSE
jgi:N-acetylneuraminate synthase